METINDILGYGMKIYQNDDFFSFSLDSIILANYATIRLKDKKIVDFCSGNGIVSLILSKRTKNNIDSVEIQEKLCELFKKSISDNNLKERINVYNCDVKNFVLGRENSYDLVLCNPPYFINDEFQVHKLSYEKAIARHEILLNLNEIIDCGKKILKDNGTFSMIHRTDRLIEIITKMKNNNIEPKKIKFIFPNINSQAEMVLIEGQKNGKSGLIIDKPLVLYDEYGKITSEYKKLQEEILK